MGCSPPLNSSIGDDCFQKGLSFSCPFTALILTPLELWLFTLGDKGQTPHLKGKLLTML